MKRSIILLAHLAVVIIAKAQSGDFQLENSQQRAYVKLNANSSLSGNGMKRWLIGKNYRKEWTDSIRVPVLDLKNDFGGLKPEKEGGGKQTRTLHLKDGNGRDWVLRSVQKFPEKVIAPEMKGTVAESLIRDGISASYPYSVLSVGTLAKASGVPYLPNTVVYIPDDAVLGEFRSKYGNSLALLELRSQADKEAKAYDTEEIIPELYKDNKKLVDQKAVLKARLLDNFIMDLDRHEGQWMWMQKDSAGKKYYYPIPKDRDQSFFKATGLLPRKLSKKSSLGQLQGLSAKPKNVLTFNYAARNFDRAFLSELDESTWSKEVDAFLSGMTDDVINNALNKQPQEIQKYKATEIADILEKKRTTFKNDMMRYYGFLSETVTVVGSNEPEVFNITKNSDGSVVVAIKDAKDSTITYQRSFNAAATREIRIYGLEGDDHFLVSGETSPIKIRVIGGPGEDVFANHSGDKKVLVYDVSFEQNSLDGKFKNKISKDPLNNEYQRINPIYNSSSFGPTAELSGEGGLFLGLRFTGTTTGFRKEPYASKHVFYVTKALRSAAWHLHYDADFLKVGRKTDLLLRTDAKLPTVRTHFFGYGNSTVFEKANGIDYYKVQYPFVEAAFLVRHPLASWFKLQYGPVMQYFNISEEKNDEYHIANLTPHEIESSTYGAKSYAGAEARIIIDTRNNASVPTRGVGFNVYTRPMTGIGGSSGTLNQTGGDFSLYTDFLFKNHIIIASSFGAHHSFGDFEIPQAQYLGVRQNLRGYRYQRFAGRTSAYNNTELRINFGDVNFYLFKGPFGVLGFHDAGRVWADGENSDKWHTGYGGGLWMAPFNKIVLMGLLTFSEEEKAFPMAKIGFQF